MVGVHRDLNQIRLEMEDDEKIVSVEAHFCESPLGKFDRLLEELVS